MKSSEGEWFEDTNQHRTHPITGLTLQARLGCGTGLTLRVLALACRYSVGVCDAMDMSAPDFVRFEIHARSEFTAL